MVCSAQNHKNWLQLLKENNDQLVLFPYQLMLQELLALRLQYSHYKYHQGKESQMVIPSKPLNYTTTTPQNHFPTTHVAKYIILHHHDASQSCLVNQCYNYCYWALLHSRSSKNDTRLFWYKVSKLFQSKVQ